MNSVQVSCPQCRVELRLRNRNLLGRRGQCPQCRHRFVLQKSGDVDLDLADGPQQAAADTSTQQQPDNVPQPHNVAARASQSAPAAQTEMEFVEIPSSDSPAAPASVLQFPIPVTPSSATTDPDFAAITDIHQTASGVRQLKLIKHRNAKRRNVEIIAGVAVALALLLAGIFFAAHGAFSGPNGTRTEERGWKFFQIGP